MSKIGKKAIQVPSGVTAAIEGKVVKLKGPKGELAYALADDQSAKLEGGAISVTTAGESKEARAKWGMARALIANLIGGVAKGYEKRLEISGVGYKAQVQGKNLQLALGFSHDINYPIPEGIAIATPKPTEIVVSGADKHRVGQVAAEIRGFRPPEPYKGKGVKYAGEFIFRKEGKKK
jgi:large subunit ribosomal protein L6